MKLFSHLKTALLGCALSSVAIFSLRAQGPGLPPAPPPLGAPGRAPRFHPPPNPLMEALDTNHDGILSADEIANAANALKKLDRNGDGQLTEDELRPPPGGRGGPPRGQPGPGNPGANPAGFRDESAPPPPPGPPPLAGRDPSTAGPAPRPLAAAVRAERTLPRLEDDPVAARLGETAPAASGTTPHPPATPLSLFELLDANHDGVLSEEELRDAPAVLKRLDLKSIPLPGVGPAGRGDLRLPLPTPAP